MKRDKTHEEFIVRWAKFVRDNPKKVWKKQHDEFIDSQINTANNFYKKLAKTPNGVDKIKRLRNISNKTLLKKRYYNKNS